MSLNELLSDDQKPWCNIFVNDLTCQGDLLVEGSAIIDGDLTVRGSIIDGSTGASNITADFITATVQLRGTASSNQLALGATGHNIIISSPSVTTPHILSVPGISSNSNFVLSETTAGVQTINDSLIVNDAVTADEFDTAGDVVIGPAGKLFTGLYQSFYSPLTSSIIIGSGEVDTVIKFLKLRENIPNDTSVPFLTISVPNDTYSVAFLVNAYVVGSPTTSIQSQWIEGGWLLQRVAGSVATLDAKTLTTNNLIRTDSTKLNVANFDETNTISGGATATNTVTLNIQVHVVSPLLTSDASMYVTVYPGFVGGSQLTIT